MKYLVLMYADPAATEAMSAEDRAAVFRRHEALHRDLENTGEMLNGAGLDYPENTTTIRWRRRARPRFPRHRRRGPARPRLLRHGRGLTSRPELASCGMARRAAG